MNTGHRIEYRPGRSDTGFAIVETIWDSNGALIAVTKPLSIELEAAEDRRVEFERMLLAYTRDPIQLEYEGRRSAAPLRSMLLADGVARLAFSSYVSEHRARRHPSQS